MLEGKLRSRLRNFVLELKRRKVIRAMVAYAVAGVGIAEGAAFPTSARCICLGAQRGRGDRCPGFSGCHGARLLDWWF